MSNVFRRPQTLVMAAVVIGGLLTYELVSTHKILRSPDQKTTDSSQPKTVVSMADVTRSQSVETPGQGDLGMTQDQSPGIQPATQAPDLPVIASKTNMSLVKQVSDEDRHLTLQRYSAAEQKLHALITDYDQNLADVERRQQIESQFAQYGSDIKAVAIMLAHEASKE